MDRCNGRAKLMESPEDWIGQIVPLSKDSITLSTAGCQPTNLPYCKSLSVLFMSKVWGDTKDFFSSTNTMLPHTTSNLRAQCQCFSTRPPEAKREREGPLLHLFPSVSFRPMTRFFEILIPTHFFHGEILLSSLLSHHAQQPPPQMLYTT